MKQRRYNKKVQLSTQLFFCRAGRLAELKGSAVKKFVAPSNSSSRDAWSMFFFLMVTVVTSGWMSSKLTKTCNLRDMFSEIKQICNLLEQNKANSNLRVGLLIWVPEATLKECEFIETLQVTANGMVGSMGLLHMILSRALNSHTDSSNNSKIKFSPAARNGDKISHVARVPHILP